MWASTNGCCSESHVARHFPMEECDPGSATTLRRCCPPVLVLTQATMGSHPLPQSALNRSGEWVLILGTWVPSISADGLSWWIVDAMMRALHSILSMGLMFCWMTVSRRLWSKRCVAATKMWRVASSMGSVPDRERASSRSMALFLHSFWASVSRSTALDSPRSPLCCEPVQRGPTFTMVGRRALSLSSRSNCRSIWTGIWV
mmetsp:Transcript_89791/g.155515  ORF Transcript_89791/g.155515 Transcript_89791/m.155515 type:complete len:202 (+) Transcript_89791:667-1272(+)